HDALHKTTKQFVEWVVAQQVNEVYLGDVEGVHRNPRIYGSPKREVVDGLFRPTPVRVCC
ncbi:hypothetical protein, partial [Aneurinibacillus thermoaerophilus]|uniref:hypothetical protein n=1 Tax=Aneurinibacillus thermoaerophilus TaxID=143495 RepID=UPI002E241817|nr:hypothetical protein [Aneurinibacillus thermoaerophilus]